MISLQNNNDTAKPIKLTTASTIVTGGDPIVDKILVCDVNGVNVGIQLYDFTDYYPNAALDLIPPYTDFKLEQALFATNSSEGYNAGLIVNIYQSTAPTASAAGTYAIPLLKIVQKDRIPSVIANNPTVSNNLVDANRFLVVNIQNKSYGIKLADFDTIYPSTATIAQSAANPTTELIVDPTLWNGYKGSGSTNLNNKIKNYEDVIRRVKNQLGYPIVEIELCDEQIIEYIDMAVEWYTKYAGYTEEFMVFDSTKYPIGRGYNLSEMLQTIYMSYANKDTSLSGNFIDYDLFSMRKVINVFSFDQAEFTGTDALFTLEYVYAQQIYYSYMLGSYGFDLVTWEALKQFLDTRKRMFSAIPRYIFDPRTQRLRIIPEPDPVNPYIGILGAYVERPIKDIIKERWVQQYTLALSKIAIGHIRGKYGNVNLFGGGSIQGGDLTSQGVTERDKLEEELLTKFGEMPPPLMFVG